MGDAEKNATDAIIGSATSPKIQNGTSLEKKILHENHQNMNISYIAPDGGSRAWLVLLCSFLCNGVIWGVINSYSVLQNEFYENLHSKNDTQASSKAGMYFSYYLFES